MDAEPQFKMAKWYCENHSYKIKLNNLGHEQILCDWFPCDSNIYYSKPEAVALDPGCRVHYTITPSELCRWHFETYCGMEMIPGPAGLSLEHVQHLKQLRKIERRNRYEEEADFYRKEIRLTARITAMNSRREQFQVFSFIENYSSTDVTYHFDISCTWFSRKKESQLL